jgi:hypothetical protein
MTKKSIILLFLISCISVGIYLIFSKVVFRISFPLDDAWIHQTFARNLINFHQWAFIPGQLTSGSTSPLWTMLLAVGYLIRLSPYIWTFLLGIILLFLASVLSEFIVRDQLPEYKTKIPWVGIFMATEWHLAWAAGSGMETLFLGDIFLLIYFLSLKKSINWWWMGGIVGVSIWIRPEGVTWLGPILLLMIIKKEGLKKKLANLGQFLTGFLVFIFLYFLFNYSLSGTAFPNTFYAKQIEYSIVLKTSYIQRLFSLAILPLKGAGLFLLPGSVLYLIQALRERQWNILFGGIWFFGYIVLYSLLLPVTYQYGRYLIPAMPIFFIFGLMGMIKVLQSNENRFIFRVLKKVWLFSVLFVSMGFIFIGGKAYADDVAFIESEMVETSKWIEKNTKTGSIIAAHDIGALGYFGNRKILDLAGLISPDIIPIIRNEKSLAIKLDELGADYLMTFPSWYETLSEGKTKVFEGKYSFAVYEGHDHMTVYRWKSP